MDSIQKIVLIVHTFIALGIIALVLLQRGKGADAGAAFGAGASGTVFGSRGSGSFFSRATAVLATAFFASSLTLAYLSSQGTTGPDSLLEGATPVEEQIDAAADESEDLPLPDMSAQEPEANSGELPSLEDDLPTLDDDTPVQDDTQ